MISGIQFNRHCPSLSHIFFADDALLFLKAELQNWKSIKSILEVYGVASGQRVNQGKRVFGRRYLIDMILLCAYITRRSGENFGF